MFSRQLYPSQLLACWRSGFYFKIYCLKRKFKMKLLTKFDSEAGAHECAAMLREKGVLTRLFSADHNYMPSVIKVGLWVVLDDQLNDARLLLSNPDHEVSHKLTEEQMQLMDAQEQELLSKTTPSLLNWLAKGLMVVASIWLIGAGIYYLLN